MDQGLLREFLTECGLDAPYSVEVFSHDDATTQVHEYRQPFLVVGQRDGSDLRLDHWLVGRRHVYLQLIDGRFRCVDLGARTGTHGGNPTERAGWVDPDRPLKIGPYLVRPLVGADPRRDYPPLPIVTWSKLDSGISEPHWSMHRPLVLVGRSPFCEFRLPDANVSQFHCGLVVTEQGVWVVDLLSQKPVLVNGEAIRFAPVQPGDTLQVGPFRLTPHYDMSLIQDARDRAGWSPLEQVITTSGSSTNFPRESSRIVSIDSTSEIVPDLTPVVIPAGTWTPTLPAGTELASLGGNDLVITALVQQLGAMQQQMFDQFHQMMLGMFTQFAELHRETSATVRAEFDEVRKLSDEIESLRLETSRLAEASTMAIQQAAFERSSFQQSSPVDSPPAPRLGSGAGPANPTTTASTRPGAVPPSGPMPPAAPAAVAAEATRRPILPPLPPAPDVPVDIHAQLCLQLGRMESERQGRLQKIWSMMMTSRT